jgi:hypothetical protein
MPGSLTRTTPLYVRWAVVVTPASIVFAGTQPKPSHCVFGCLDCLRRPIIPSHHRAARNRNHGKTRVPHQPGKDQHHLRLVL